MANPSDDQRAARLKGALLGLGLVGRKIEKHAAEAPTTFEAVTRQMVEQQAEQLAEIRKWIFGIFAAVVIAIVLQVVR